MNGMITRSETSGFRWQYNCYVVQMFQPGAILCVCVWGGGGVTLPQNTRNLDWQGNQRNWQGNFFDDLAN